jgi:hypothetical protein
MVRIGMGLSGIRIDTLIEGGQYDESPNLTCIWRKIAITLKTTSMSEMAC